MMIGLPFDEEAFKARWSGPPKPKGPKPLLPAPGSARASGGAGASPEPAAAETDADAGGLPPGSQLIGRPGPPDRRYALGRDQYGPVLHGLDPLQPRERTPPTGPEPS
jgi:hypothetical protein